MTNPKIISVQEFDRIVCDSQYERVHGYVVLKEEHFRELEQFVRSHVPEDGDADALQFMKLGFHRAYGNYISVRNYVGVIQLRSGLTIEVLPKIYLSGEINRLDATREIFMRMLRSLRNFNGESLGFANLRTDRIDLYEVFIGMYLEEVRKLVRHGLRSDYVSVTDNRGVCKGKILMQEQLRQNIAHRERFYVAFDEYFQDRAENRLIKATLLKLRKLTRDARNQKLLRQLLIAFEQVRPSYHYEADFSMVKADRNMKDYDLLLRWARVFLLNKSFSVFSGETMARAILFPMERLFEAYVATELQKRASSLKWHVKTQHQEYYLFDVPKRFSLRPDIVLEKDDKQILMDTKWKRLSPFKANYGISQTDMYQMYAYAKKYSKDGLVPDVWLLYPASEETEKIQTRSFVSYDGVNVELFFVDCTDTNSIGKLCGGL